MKCFLCKSKMTKKETEEGDVCDYCYKFRYKKWNPNAQEDSPKSI